MTRLLWTGVVLAAAGALSTPGLSSGTPPLVRASGKITSISPKRIAVRHLSCSIRRVRARNLAARFVVGDRVSIACRGGVLQTLTRVSVPISSQGSSGPSYDSSPPPSGQTVTITVGGEATTRGTITSFGPIGAEGCPPPRAGARSLGNCASITINGISCAISQELYAVIRSEYNIGDTATIFCDQAGQLRAIGPNGI